MPERGRLVRVGVWAAGVNQTSTAYLCVWSASTGALLGESEPVTFGSQTPATGHVSLYAADLIVPVDLDAADDFLAGFWRPKTRSHQLTGRSSGAHFDKQDASRDSFAAPRNTGGHTFGNYSVGIHAYYDPFSGAWTRRAGVTIRADDTFIRRGGVNAIPDRVAVRRAGGWVDAD